MKIKVSHKSLELKLSPEEVKGLINLNRIISSKLLVDTEMKTRADILIKRLEAAQIAMEAISWRDGV